MKIIADTNIWYQFGKDPEFLEKAKGHPIHPTFANIYELVKSHNVIDKPETSRPAIQSLFTFKENVIYEPPLIYLAKLNCDFEYDLAVETYDVLKFSMDLARGAEIAEEKKEEFREILDKKRNELQEASNFFNEEAEKIQDSITNKKEHKAKETHSVTISFLDFCVKSVTNEKCNLDKFDPNQIELLVRTLDHYFKEIETSKMKIQPNDWFDFAMLAYVHPGDKYYTFEKRWNRLIEEAGCGDYLFTL